MRHRPNDDDDVEAILLRLELRAMEIRLMAAIDDLNTKLDALTTSQAAETALVAQLRSAQGVPEDQVAAAAARLDPILAAQAADQAPPA